MLKIPNPAYEKRHPCAVHEIVNAFPQPGPFSAAVEGSARYVHDVESSPKAYATGSLRSDFRTREMKEFFIQHMRQEGLSPFDRGQLVGYLHRNPVLSASVSWTPCIDDYPYYTIEPAGAYAKETYALLRRFFKQIADSEDATISIPGTIGSWKPLAGERAARSLVPSRSAICFWTGNGPQTFKKYILGQGRNAGQTSAQRAVNYAMAWGWERRLGTDDGNAGPDTSAQLEIDRVDAVKSPVCRPGSDCHDVAVELFHPDEPGKARQVHRLCVDVSGVIPVVLEYDVQWSS
jgi:hypothetical protein